LHTRIARHVLLALAALALCEVAARVWLQRLASDASFRRFASIAEHRERGSQWSVERHAYLGYVPRPLLDDGTNLHDSRGFRGTEVASPKPSGEYRIVCLGGSTTYTQNVADWRESYPAQLEAALRARGHGEVRVVNAGVANWTSFEHLIGYELRVAELDADLIVVLEGANDLKTRFVWPPEHYRGDNSGFRSFTTNLRMPPLAEHFALWRIVAVSAGWMRPHADLEIALDNHTGRSLWGALRAQMIDGSYPSGELAQASTTEILRSNPPLWFERNLEDLAVLAARHGSEVLFLTTPCCPERIARSELAARDFRAGIEEMNAALRGVCARSGAGLFDLAGALPCEPALYFDEVHHTAAGARRLAELLAQHVEQCCLAGTRADGR
jgi:lysophospholipase L1-like esterase